MIAYSITDLLFATRIKSTADSLHIEARPARTPDRLTDLLHGQPPVKAVIIDLEMDGDPLEMIRIAKSGDSGREPGARCDDQTASTTRENPHRVRVIAFGPHVRTDLLNAAREAGADEVMPRSRLAKELPAVLEELAG